MYTIKKGGMIMKLSNKRMNGFTLAEVLITLGIIGVVAAMTMPTLMNSTQGAQYKAAYKKALSAIAQGITLNVALDDQSFADADEAGTAGEYNESKRSVAVFLAKRMNVVEGKTSVGYDPALSATNNSGVTDGANNTTLFFNDGITFQFNPAQALSCTRPDPNGPISPSKTACSGFIDVNGIKGPNKIIACDNGTQGDTCTVKNPTDIYPVVFYDSSILPSTDAGRAVLYGK